MLHHLFVAFTLACAIGSVAVPLAARAASPGSPVDASTLRAWLMRMHEAGSHRNFQGTFVVSAGGTVSSSRIAHYCVGASQFEHIEALDGQMRHVFRHNDTVHTLWPKSQVALIEQRDLVASFPTLLRTGSDRIVDFYDASAQGSERVAGHEANVLLLRPKDKRRYGYRLWADRDTGLLLRAEVLGERNEVLEASAFSDLTIGGKSRPDSVLAPMKKLDGYRILRPTLTPVRFETEGWTLRQAVPGFEPVSCVKRPLGVPGDAAAHTPTQVLQAIYSDGLTYVSVFIEPFDPALHARGAQSAMGATQTLMTRVGDWWVTLVGDVPALTLHQFAAALEYKK